MALFAFELNPVEDIVPWGGGDNRSLNWFALSEGRLRITAGEHDLFRYSDAILAHWGKDVPVTSYFLAELARDILKAVRAGLAPLPAHIEQIASSWEVLMRLRDRSKVREDSEDFEAYDQYIKAWSWLEDRSPWTSYSTSMPQIHFVRFGSEIRIYWDNRDHTIEGIGVWAAQHGSHTLSVEAFLAEWTDFATQLLGGMEARIEQIAAGTAKPQIEVDLDVLRQEHRQWQSELQSNLIDEEEEEPAVSWKDTGDALNAIAKEHQD